MFDERITAPDCNLQGFDLSYFRATLFPVEVEFDLVKRDRTLRERGLDLAHADRVFEGLVFTLPDLRRDYGEDRFNTAGYLDGRLVVMAWTPRGTARRIISMRHAHDDEERRWRAAADF